MPPRLMNLGLGFATFYYVPLDVDEGWISFKS